MPKDIPPPVREGEDFIEIDMKKGRWPYAKFGRLEDGSVVIYLDCNEGGQVIGQGVGLAALRLSAKKARRLREFLERTES